MFDLYGMSASSANVSLAIQHFVPALPVRKVVCPLGSRLLMPKSANLALPLTSAGQITKTNSGNKMFEFKYFYMLLSVGEFYLFSVFLTSLTNQNILWFEIPVENWRILRMKHPQTVENLIDKFL